MELPYLPHGAGPLSSALFRSWRKQSLRRGRAELPAPPRGLPQWLIHAVPLHTSAWRLCVRPPCQTPPRLESCWGPLQTSMCGGKTVPLLLSISIKTFPPCHKVFAELILLNSVWKHLFNISYYHPISNYAGKYLRMSHAFWDTFGTLVTLTL